MRESPELYRKQLEEAAERGRHPHHAKEAIAGLLLQIVLRHYFFLRAHI
jgi:hypothetical protein